MDNSAAIPSNLRLKIYDALERSSYCTIPDLASELGFGVPQAQDRIRDVLHAEPEAFWQDEDCWDLAIFHRFEALPHLFRSRRKGIFDKNRFFGFVLDDALRLKAAPISVKILAEKYLLKIAKSAGLHSDEFPRGSGGAQNLLNEFLAATTRFYVIENDYDQQVWTAEEWHEPSEAVQPPVMAFTLPDDFCDHVIGYLNRLCDRPARLLDILKEILKDTDQKDFPSAFTQANAALAANPNVFTLVRDQGWMLTAHLPDFIEEIPARVAIPRWRNPQEERLVGELQDVVRLEAPDGMSRFVDEETDATEAQFKEDYYGPLRLVLPYHWRQAGVLRVNARERCLFPDHPSRVHLEIKDRLTNQFFFAWLNNNKDNRYIYGLKDWYEANLVPAGGIFYIQRASGSFYNFEIWINEAKPHTFDGKQFFCEVDSETYIEEARLRDLEALRAKVEAAQATIKDVMCDLFESDLTGHSLHYKQIWSQVHVIRPTTRRTVASILSAFPCFYQTERGSGLWHYQPNLRNAPHRYMPIPQVVPTRKPAGRPPVARPPRPPRGKPAEPTVMVRPQCHWLVPVHFASWEAMASPAEAGKGVFMVEWSGRTQVVQGDQLFFYDVDGERVVAAVELLRAPVRDVDSNQRKVAVRLLLEKFAPLPYADVARALSVSQPEEERTLPIEITAEDATLLLERLQLTAPQAMPVPEAELPIVEEEALDWLAQAEQVEQAPAVQAETTLELVEIFEQLPVLEPQAEIQTTAATDELGVELPLVTETVPEPSESIMTVAVQLPEVKEPEWLSEGEPVQTAEQVPPEAAPVTEPAALDMSQVAPIEAQPSTLPVPVLPIPEKVTEPVTLIPPKLTGEMETLAVRLRANPEDHEAVLGLARGWVHLGDVAAACEAYGELVRSGKLIDHVISDLKALLKDYPNAAGLISLLGDAHIKVGMVRMALRFYRQALKKL